MANLSAEEIEQRIQHLSERRVKYRVELASTPHVARRIIRRLPGVQDLKKSAAGRKAVLNLLRDERTVRDNNLTAISLDILDEHPSKEVETALARYINARRFTGINMQLAAETFLKAAGRQAAPKDAIAEAMREAKLIEIANSSNLMMAKKPGVKPGAKAGLVAKPGLKASGQSKPKKRSIAHKRTLAAKK
jgi:hypothetical protein